MPAPQGHCKVELVKQCTLWIPWIKNAVGMQNSENSDLLNSAYFVIVILGKLDQRAMHGQ